MIALIDNYDSFTYNLYQYILEIRADVQVFRNDKITLEDIIELDPSHIIISPGPCTPLEAGISVDVIRELSKIIPTLGVCLGHQCIGHVTAWTENDLVMGLRHKEYPIEGVQFHPESIMTEHGKKIINNFFEKYKWFR